MKKKYWILFLMILLIVPGSMAQEAKFKALFMYNFTKYLEWPSNKQSGDFVIGVFGNSPIIAELKIIAQKKKVGNQPIVIKKLSSLSEANTCHILYIPENRSVDEAEVKNQCSNKGTVIITDKPGLAKSFSGINYVKVNGKQNFEVNKKNIDEQGIKVNSELLSLGINVN